MNNIIDLIKKWRTTFDLPVRSIPQIPAIKEAELALSLIYEEYIELQESLENLITDNGEKTSLNEVADAIGDLYFVVTQMACIFGFEPTELVEKVFESNMSKLVHSEIEIDKNIDYYKSIGIPTYYQKLENGKYIIKRMSDNKVLKSINFFEPKWKYDERI